jgi:hypothetical protein
MPNLRDLAAAHHRLIVGNVDNGFAREITLVSPDGLQATVSGLWNDAMPEALDAQTGSLVATRSVFVRLPNKAIRDAGFTSLPRGKHEGNPWLVLYTGLGGREQKTKVSEVRVDRTFDAVDCFLEPYQ